MIGFVAIMDCAAKWIALQKWIKLQKMLEGRGGANESISGRIPFAVLCE
jgi:hypothetical protein